MNPTHSQHDNFLIAYNNRQHAPLNSIAFSIQKIATHINTEYTTCNNTQHTTLKVGTGLSSRPGIQPRYKNEDERDQRITKRERERLGASHYHYPAPEMGWAWTDVEKQRCGCGGVLTCGSRIKGCGCGAMTGDLGEAVDVDIRVDMFIDYQTRRQQLVRLDAIFGAWFRIST